MVSENLFSSFPRNMIAEQKNWNKDSKYSIQETIFRNQEQKHRNKDS